MKQVFAEISINAKSDKIIEAFLDEKMMQAWWGLQTAFVDRKVGGIYTLAWEKSQAGYKYVSSGIIEVYLPDSQLIISKIVYLGPDRPIMGPLSIHISATPKNHEVLLKIIQAGFQDGTDWEWYYDAVTEGWSAVLPKLKSFLESH